MTKRCNGNLKPAPFALTPRVVEGLISPNAPLSKRTVLVPFGDLALVDLPKGGDR